MQRFAPDYSLAAPSAVPEERYAANQYLSYARQAGLHKDRHAFFSFMEHISNEIIGVNAARKQAEEDELLKKKALTNRLVITDDMRLASATSLNKIKELRGTFEQVAPLEPLLDSSRPGQARQFRDEGYSRSRRTEHAVSLESDLDYLYQAQLRAQNRDSLADLGPHYSTHQGYEEQLYERRRRTSSDLGDQSTPDNMQHQQQQWSSTAGDIPSEEIRREPQTSSAPSSSQQQLHSSAGTKSSGQQEESAAAAMSVSEPSTSASSALFVMSGDHPTPAPAPAPPKPQSSSSNSPMPPSSKTGTKPQSVFFPPPSGAGAATARSPAPATATAVTTLKPPNEPSPRPVGSARRSFSIGEDDWDDESSAFTPTPPKPSPMRTRRKSNSMGTQSGGSTPAQLTQPPTQTQTTQAQATPPVSNTASSGTATAVPAAVVVPAPAPGTPKAATIAAPDSTQSSPSRVIVSNLTSRSNSPPIAIRRTPTILTSAAEAVGPHGLQKEASKEDTVSTLSVEHPPLTAQSSAEDNLPRGRTASRDAAASTVPVRTVAAPPPPQQQQQQQHTVADVEVDLSGSWERLDSRATAAGSSSLPRPRVVEGGALDDPETLRLAAQQYKRLQKEAATAAQHNPASHLPPVQFVPAEPHRTTSQSQQQQQQQQQQLLDEPLRRRGTGRPLQQSTPPVQPPHQQQQQRIVGDAGGEQLRESIDLSNMSYQALRDFRGRY